MSEYSPSGPAIAAWRKPVLSGYPLQPRTSHSCTLMKASVASSASTSSSSSSLSLAGAQGASAASAAAAAGIPSGSGGIGGPSQLWVYGGWTGEDVSQNFLALTVARSKEGDSKARVTVTVESKQPLERAEKRVGHTAVMVERNVYVYGGWNGKKYTSAGLLYDVDQSHLLVEKQHDDPTPRRDHSMVKCGRKYYLFGGWNGNDQFNDMWSWDSKKVSWGIVETVGTAPCPRRGHVAVTVGKKIYIFGGIFGFSKFLNDIFVFDTTNNEWSQLTEVAGEGPSPRAWHSGVSLGSSGQILIFGGSAGRLGFFNDLYIFDTNKPAWFKLPVQNPSEAPLPRCSHTATRVDNMVVIFGGISSNFPDLRVRPLSDMIILDTGLTVTEPVEEEDTTQDEEEDAREKQDEDFSTEMGIKQERLSGADMDIVQTFPQGRLTHSPSITPGTTSLESWLSILTPASKQGSVDVWNRRFVRVRGNELSIYEYRWVMKYSWLPSGLSSDVQVCGGTEKRVTW